MSTFWRVAYSSLPAPPPTPTSFLTTPWSFLISPLKPGIFLSATVLSALEAGRQVGWCQAVWEWSPRSRSRPMRKAPEWICIACMSICRFLRIRRSTCLRRMCRKGNCDLGLLGVFIYVYERRLHWPTLQLGSPSHIHYFLPQSLSLGRSKGACLQ